jgi:hypothetical protein
MASSLMLSMSACMKTSGNEETTVSQVQQSSSTATSEETSVSSETTENQTKNLSSLEDDLYNVYADPAYSLPKTFRAIAQNYESTWHEELSFSLDKGTLVEVYDINNKEIAEARWKISQAERLNDYSLRIKITDLVSSNFTDIKYPEEYCRLNKGDELIIYLPNTPTDDIAFEVYKAAAYKNGQPDDPQRRLQAFCVYNPASNGACRILMHALFVIEKTSGDDMKNWYGDYYSKSGEKVKIYEEPSSHEPRVDLLYAGGKQCNGMQVRKEKDDPSKIYAFGKADDGTVIVIGIDSDDEGGYSLEVFESAEGDEDKGFGKDHGIKLQKKNNK